MDNSAFRKFLENSRAVTAQRATAPPPQPGTGKKKRSKGSEKYQRLQEQKQKQKEREKEESKYRDRADERRKEINPDYKTDVQKLLEVDIEKSKFLGGDVEHTHLVKGLDYALLSKVRDEITTDNAGATVPQVQQSKKTAKIPQGLKKGSSRTTSAAQVLPTRTSTQLATIPTRTRMGKSLAFFMSRTMELDKPPLRSKAGRPTKTATEETFERLGFEFQLADGPSHGALTDLPTMVSRAKVNWGGTGIGKDAEDDHLLALVDDVLVDRVVKALNYRREGKRSKKRSRSSLQARTPGTSVAAVVENQHTTTAHAPPPVDDFDIFEGAGRYDAEEAMDPAVGGSKKQGGEETNSGYFINLRAASKAELNEEQAQQEEGQGPWTRDVGTGLNSWIIVDGTEVLGLEELVHLTFPSAHTLHITAALAPANDPTLFHHTPVLPHPVTVKQLDLRLSLVRS